MMWSCPSSWLLLGLMDHLGREEEDHTSSHLMAKHVHISLMVAYKLLSLGGNIHDVVMSIFVVAPRSHGPSRERGRRSHIITSYGKTCPHKSHGGL
jgi:hypothetical protein